MNVRKRGSITGAVFKALRVAGIKNVLMLKGGVDLGVHQLSSYNRDLKKWASGHVLYL